MATKYKPLPVERIKEAVENYRRNPQTTFTPENIIQEWGDLIAVLPELLTAFLASERICKKALPKFDWGKSALDGEAIMALNEGMLTMERTRAVLPKMEATNAL